MTTHPHIAHPWAVDHRNGRTVVTFDGEPFVAASSTGAALGAVDRLNRMDDGDYAPATDPDAELFAAWVLIWGGLTEAMPHAATADLSEMAMHAVNDLRTAGFMGVGP